MESLNELQKELWAAESELASISIDKHNPVKYDYERGETHGEEVHYNEYTDPVRARYLINHINYLKKQIKNYNKNANIQNARNEFYQGIREEAKESEITATAHDMYEQAQSDYKKKSVFGKLGAIFTGKKPKSLYDSDDIMKEYRQAAEQAIKNEYSDNRIAEIERQRAYITEKFKDKPAIIATYNAQFDKEIAELQGKDITSGKSK